MGAFVERNLGDGEAITYTAKLSLWRYWANFVLGGGLALIAGSALVASTFKSSHASASAATGFELLLLVCALVVFLRPFLARKATELVITNKRLIAKFGLLSTRSIDIRFDKIESVRVTQGLLGKMLDYGDITVTGTGSTFDPILHISKPMAFRTALSNATESSKSSGS